MKRIFDILKTYKSAVVWTICYVLGVYFILRFLFNFDLLMAKNWARLLHLELHGFAGLTFGILILAAIPLYVATTTVIVRNKSGLFNLPLPRCFKDEELPKEEKKSETTIVPEKKEEIVLPAHMPKEMYEGFARARRNLSVRQYSAFNKPIKEETEQPVQKQVVKSEPVHELVESEPTPEELKSISKSIIETKTESTIPVPDVIMHKKKAIAERAELKVSSGSVKDSAEIWPLPETFEIKEERPEVSVPVFSNITFGDEDEENDVIQDIPETETIIETKNESDKDEFLDYLHNLGIDVVRKDNLYVTEKYALALHNDDDFWVADELDWFAPGKQKPSPIKSLLEIKEQGVKPVLCLGSQNIMDIDTLKAQWEKSGITVLTELSEIEKLLTSDD